jgi:ribosomal protein S7
MITPFRDLTEKHRSLRHPSDPLYFSRTVRTLFNKFTKRGKKVTTTKHLHNAFIRYRINILRIRSFTFLTRTFRRLRTTIKIVYRRKAKKIHEIPIPAFRNRADAARFQAIYKAINKHSDRILSSRIFREFNDLTFHPKQAASVKEKSAFLAHAYANRADFEMR